MLRILIAEDDEISRIVLEKILSPYGFCELSVDGEEALQKYNRSLEKGISYDLVCLDIMMPKKNGQEVLREIRNIERKNKLKSSKILMATALGDDENIKDSFENECDAYFLKPISKDKILNTIQRLGLIKRM